MKQTLLSIVLFLIVTTIGVIVVEGFARWKFGVPLSEKLPLVRVKSDPDSGWIMVPGDTHYTYDKQVQLNAHGFRGPEIHAKLEDEYRIIALGDSHIYGQGLEDESLITTVMEKGLNNRGQDCFFRVINMGVRAYSINNELAVLKKFGIPLNPDHVILFFYINDFQKVNIERRYNNYLDKDWYMFDFSDKPTKQIIRKWNMMQVLRKSALIMWIHDVYMAIANSNNFENRILKGVLDNELKEGIQFVQDSLDDLIRLSKKYRFSVTLAVIPVSAQAVNNYPKELYQSTLRQYARQYDIDIVDLLPALRSYYEQSGNLPMIPYDGHYNAAGHKAFSIAMVKHLRGLNIKCKSKN